MVSRPGYPCPHSWLGSSRRREKYFADCCFQPGSRLSRTRGKSPTEKNQADNLLACRETAHSHASICHET